MVQTSVKKSNIKEASKKHQVPAKAKTDVHDGLCILAKIIAKMWREQNTNIEAILKNRHNSNFKGEFNNERDK